MSSLALPGSRRRTDRWTEMLLLAPTTLLVGATVLLPIGYTIWLSTRHVDLTEGGPWRSIGIANYRTLASDPSVHGALLRTLYYTSLTVTLTVTIAFGIALVIRQRFLGRGLLLVIALVPWAIAPVANGIFWRYIFNPDYGFLNAVAFKLGLIDTYQNWLGSSTRALALAAVADSWKFVPFVALVLLVALEGIPKAMYRAARIDGAGALQAFWHVTLPGVKRSLILVTIFQTLFTLQTFDLIYVLTRGGPGDATTVLNFLVFREAFEFFDLGSAAALGVILAVLTLAMAGFALAVAARRSAARSAG